MHGYKWPINCTRTRREKPGGRQRRHALTGQQHLVRYYGTEEDREFVYLAMEEPLSYIPGAGYEYQWQSLADLLSDYAQQQVWTRIFSAMICAQQYVGKSQSCMVINGRLTPHAAQR